jgi:hypothetical protein
MTPLIRQIDPKSVKNPHLTLLINRLVQHSEDCNCYNDGHRDRDYSDYTDTGYQDSSRPGYRDMYSD